MAKKFELTVDVSDFQRKIDLLHAVLNPKEMKTLVRRVVRRTGGTVRRIVRQDVPIEYAVKPMWAASKVGNPRFANTSGGIACNIPLNGERGVNGQVFQATQNGKSRVRVLIINERAGTLPEKMKHQGGNAPFLVRGKRIVYTRRTKKRFPIVRVAGVGLPQMPLNRSEDKVSDDINDTLDKRLEHEFNWMMGRIK